MGPSHAETATRAAKYGVLRTEQISIDVASILDCMENDGIHLQKILRLIQIISASTKLDLVLTQNRTDYLGSDRHATQSSWCISKLFKPKILKMTNAAWSCYA